MRLTAPGIGNYPGIHRGIRRICIVERGIIRNLPPKGVVSGRCSTRDIREGSLHRVIMARQFGRGSRRRRSARSTPTTVGRLRSTPQPAPSNQSGIIARPRVARMRASHPRIRELLAPNTDVPTSSALYGAPKMSTQVHPRGCDKDRC